jgi:hypothetical protein
MANDYLLLEDAFKLILEDASGDLILESVDFLFAIEASEPDCTEESYESVAY